MEVDMPHSALTHWAGFPRHLGSILCLFTVAMVVMAGAVPSRSNERAELPLQTCGGFVDIGAALMPVSLSSVAWGDYDNDGDLDILLTGQTSTGRVAKVYRNDGGTFTDIGAPLIGVYFSSVAWGDHDND